MKKSSFVLFTLVMLSSSHTVNASKVNGDLSDECDLLLQKIEKTIQKLHSDTMGQEFILGQYIEEYGVKSLIGIYKDLCN